MNIHDPNMATPKVTTGPLAGSRKIYSTPDAAPDLRVPLREIALSMPSRASRRCRSTTPPAPTPTTTPTIDVEKGLPRTRIEWVKERGGVEEYEGRADQAGRQRQRHRQAPGAQLPQHAEAAGARSTASRSRNRMGRAPASSPRR